MTRIQNDADDPVSQFEKDLRIDPSALDIEWLEQPQKFFKYSKELSYAKRELDRLKQKYEVLKAKIDNKIRSQYPDKKPTETAIYSMVIQNEEIMQGLKEIADQELVVDLLVGGVKALEQRKSALENEVKLQGMNYFAAPREPRDLIGEYEKRTNDVEISKKIAASTAGRR